LRNISIKRAIVFIPADDRRGLTSVNSPQIRQAAGYQDYW